MDCWSPISYTAMPVRLQASPSPPLPAVAVSPFLLQVIASKARKQVHRFKYILKLQNKLSPFKASYMLSILCAGEEKGLLPKQGCVS